MEDSVSDRDREATRPLKVGLLLPEGEGRMGGETASLAGIEAFASVLELLDHP
jgi:hypothetical protein